MEDENSKVSNHGSSVVTFQKEQETPKLTTF